MTKSGGNHLVLFIPPSWILAGTEDVASTETDLILKDAIYVESIADGHSALGSLATAKSPSELHRVTSRFWPLPDGIKIRREAVFISVPAVSSFRALARREEAAAIKRAAGE